MNLAQRVNLKILKRQLVNITKQIADIKDNCRHTVVERDEVAYCEDCETDFGWWCPDSPDHFCHYGIPPKKKKNCMWCTDYLERK